MLQQERLPAARAQPVEPDDILPQRGPLRVALAQGALKGGIILPRGPRRAPPAQPVRLGSRATTSLFIPAAPRIWW